MTTKKESASSRIFFLLDSLRERQLEAEESLDWQLLRLAVAILAERPKHTFKFKFPMTAVWFSENLCGGQDAFETVEIHDAILVSRNKDPQILVKAFFESDGKNAYQQDLDFQDLCLTSRCRIIDEMWKQIADDNKKRSDK